MTELNFKKYQQLKNLQVKHKNYLVKNPLKLN